MVPAADAKGVMATVAANERARTLRNAAALTKIALAAMCAT